MAIIADVVVRRSRVLYAASLALTCVPGLRCVPVPSDQGGSIPPPTLDGGGGASDFDPNFNLNSDGPAGGDTLVFAVSIDAHSLLISGIVIDAELTVARGEDAFGEVAYTSASLVDSQNTSIADVGIVGGLSLSATSGSASSFDLTTGADGGAFAVFRADVGGANPNRFVLPEGLQVFLSGTIGTTYEVQSGSQFSFVIDGDLVTGDLALRGVPIGSFSGSDVYEGTFRGTRTR